MPNAVQYAENDLGVHLVYEEAQERLIAHQDASAAVANLNRLIRQDKDALDDRQSTLVAQHGAALADIKTKVDRKAFMDQVMDDDPECQRLRGRIADHEADRAERQSEVAHHKIGLEMLTARMQELGGLLHFYAASKMAQATATPQVQ